MELEKELFQSLTGWQWKKIGVKPHHGINLPLSALRSKNSCGIGEFFDLIPMIDWCQKLKIDFIQLLPLNNTNSESDPSPYNAISSCAINPLYLSLQGLPHLEKLPELATKLSELSKFNDTDRITYTEVLSHKLHWLREYFHAVGEQLLSSPELKQFVADNPWLKPYALFRTLKSQLNNTSWQTWPDDLKNPTPESLENLYTLHNGNLSFNLVLQYLCYIQLKKIKEYAHTKGLLLMGDIPILLSSESADVWQYPHYFNTELSAGAPPDLYNKEGQNWGFPLFQWDALRKDQFGWWKQRLRYAENFFDLCRIDHVIGFFRIWAIPPNLPSSEGHFIPENELEWEPQGRELLSMIAASTEMLPIAEDLGTVPNCVRPCLKHMGICGTKVMRWERNWDDDESYIPIQDYPPISISCLSTHDSETLTLWWEKFPEEAKLLAKFKNWIYAPSLSLKQREALLWDSHHTSSLFHVNLLQEYLALFPDLIRPNPEDERINIPGTLLPTNWSYRFKPPVEEITAHKELLSKMEQILYSTAPPSV